MFFDHQRAAFSELLGQIAQTNLEWANFGYEEGAGMIAPVPQELYQQLLDVYYKHLLFLDSECVMAMELVFEFYKDSLPYDDGSGHGPRNRDVQEPYDNSNYLLPRLAAVFQQKLGLSSDQRNLQQIALLGAIRVLNHYHFPDIGLPIRGHLKLKRPVRAAEAVALAEKNLSTLLEKMRDFQRFLREDSGFFHEAELSVTRYLAVRDRIPPNAEV